MEASAILFRLAIVATVLFVHCLHVDGHTLNDDKNNELSILEGSQAVVTHRLQKRESVLGTVASEASFSDVKVLTKLIFQNLKKNFKAARNDSKGKSWTQFLRALVGACTSAVTQAVTELITMKAKAKMTSFATNSFKSFTDMFGKK